jgi:hypothetical protein
MKSVWFKMLMYSSVSFIAPYLVFLAGVFDAWTTDRTVKLDVPPWVWGYLTLQSLSQTFIVLRAFTDGSFARHTEEVAEAIAKPDAPGTDLTGNKQETETNEKKG